MLFIVTEEISNLPCCLFQHLDPGQINHAEMIRLFPVETAAVDQENLFIPEKIKGKLFVVRNIEPFYIDLREDVESSFWFHSADAGDIGQCFVNIIPLFADASAWFDIAMHALMAAQRCLDDGLCRDIGAETHVGEHLKAFDIIFRDLLVSA